MIFLTVGTQFPFDRLVMAVDEAVGENGLGEQVFAQIGTSTYSPKNFEAVPELEKNLFDKYFSEASSIISHAGMGTITMALESGKPLLVMPRLKKYGEVVNDHQLVLARKFEQNGYLLVAYDGEYLLEKMKNLKKFIPQRRQVNSDLVVSRISSFLGSIEAKE